MSVSHPPNTAPEPIGTAPCSSTAVGDSDVVVAVIALFPVPMAQLFSLGCFWLVMFPYVLEGVTDAFLDGERVL